MDDSHNDIFVGQQFPGGMFIGTSFDPRSIIAGLFMLVAIPFALAHMVVDRFGWFGLVALIGALVALVWWMVATNLGRVFTTVLVFFCGAAITTFVVGGLIAFMWNVTS